MVFRLVNVQKKSRRLNFICHENAREENTLVRKAFPEMVIQERE